MKTQHILESNYARSHIEQNLKTASRKTAAVDKIKIHTHYGQSAKGGKKAL